MTSFTRNLFIRIGIIAVGAVLLWGCAPGKNTPADPFFDTWRAKAETAKGYSPKAAPQHNGASAKPPAPSPPPAPAPAADQSLPTMPVTLTMHDTPVATVLRTLARAAGQSIVISDTVAGAANVNATDVPWDKVFLGIVGTYGLSWEQTGGIIKIKTTADLEKEWEKEKAELRQKQMRLQLRQVDDFQTEIFFVRYADATRLVDILSALIEETGAGTAALGADGALGPQGLQRASVTVDENNNALVVRLPEKRIAEVARVIAQLDRPTAQILIEAQIVETNRDTARALGVQWGGLNYETDGDKLHWIGGPVGTYEGSLFTEAQGDDPGGDVIVHQPPIGNIVSLPADIATGLTLGYQLQDIASNYILNMQLSALQEEGKLNILSTPSITTLDNQPAAIESGREVPYQTVEDDEVKIEFKKAVLSLKVTPHTIDKTTLRLNVVTHKDELDFTNAVQGNPTIITKNAETNVILFDGQTMVIGGLSKETATESASSVPLLGDVPLLGRLFKSTSKSGDMEEVLIFITPHILGERPEAAAAKPPTDLSGTGP